MTPNELVIYPSLGVRVRRTGAGWLIEQYDDDKQWQRVGSAFDTETLMRNLAARLYGLPVSKEAWEILTDMAERERPVARPGRKGLGFLANTPRYATDVEIPKHAAGDFSGFPTEPKPLPCPVVPPAPSSPQEAEDVAAVRAKLRSQARAIIAQHEAEDVFKAEMAAWQAAHDATMKELEAAKSLGVPGNEWAALRKLDGLATKRREIEARWTEARERGDGAGQQHAKAMLRMLDKVEATADAP